MSVENPRTYESKLGTDIYPEFPNRNIHIPPEWVRSRTGVPSLGEFACLSKDVESLFPVHVRKVLVDYVTRWESNVLKYGTHLIIAGHVSHMKSNWAASAVINELTMRYSHRAPLNTEWFGGGSMKALLDAKAKKDDSYFAWRNRLYRTTLLLIEQPFKIVGDTWEMRSFLETIYEARERKRLPTITTLNTDLRSGDWSVVKQFLGPYITDSMEANNHGFIAQY